MMRIDDLLTRERWTREFAAQPEMDPLTEEDALQEAQLLDVRFDALRSTLGLLFELRLALQLQGANTGVLVAQGVRDVAWTADARDTDLTAWSVLGSVPRNENRLFGLSLQLWPRAKLVVRAESAAFFVGEVPGLERIPDYGEDEDAVVRACVAGWGSQFAPVHAVFLDPPPSES